MARRLRQGLSEERAEQHMRSVLERSTARVHRYVQGCQDFFHTCARARRDVHKGTHPTGK